MRRQVLMFSESVCLEGDRFGGNHMSFELEGGMSNPPTQSR